MPFDADGRSRQQPNHFHLPLLIFEDASEHPPIGSFIGKVFVFHPPARFTPVSTTCPFPNRLKDGVVNSMENRFTDHVTVIERPSAYLRIKGYDQFASSQVTTFFDTRPDLAEKCLYVLLRWGNEELGALPLRYLRIVCPRKSNPCSMCVTTVFSGESSNPRSLKNCSMRGFTSCSSNSFELPVTQKSSA